MQMKIQRGGPGTGKTSRLRDAARMAGQDEHQIIQGDAYNEADLELLVRCRVGQGYRVICINDCSEQQIERLRGLKGDLPAELTINAVVAS